MIIQEFKHPVATIDIFINNEMNMKKMIAADREGRVIIWDLSTKKIIAQNETDCGDVRSIHYLPQGDRFVMVCASGPIWTFSEKFEQIDFFHAQAVQMGIQQNIQLQQGLIVQLLRDGKDIVLNHISLHHDDCQYLTFIHTGKLYKFHLIAVGLR